MRISGGFMITALLAAAFALYLMGRDAGSSIDAVTTVADQLREQGVEGRTLEPGTAKSMIDVMDGLVEYPESISDHVDDLRIMVGTSAAWAAAAAPASRELHIAVSLRSAAGDLRAYALRPSQSLLMRARRRLDQARSSLEGGSGDGGTDEPRLVTDGLRDQLQNLEQAQREQQQQVDEALKR